MTDARAVWPEPPPEVPPPWRPGEPDEPDRPEPTPTVPTVAPPSEPQDDLGLLERRIVLLLGPVEPGTATRVAAQVMALDADDDAPIRLHVSSEDGELTSALMLADVVDLARSPVVALAKGVVGGVALAPFCAAARRLAAPRATFRLREPRLSLSGDADELTAGAEAIRQQVERLRRWVADATGQPRQQVADDMRRGRTLTARTAVGYGLIDRIVTSERPARADLDTDRER